MRRRRHGWLVGWIGVTSGALVFVVAVGPASARTLPLDTVLGSPGTVSQPLIDVSMDSATDGWAIGASAVVHWDGHSWSSVPAPAGHLRAVTAIAPDDAWIVGSRDDTGKPLTDHWDGTTWTHVKSPARDGTAAEPRLLTSVSAVSADDVWAVGYWLKFGTQAWPYAIHWDGQSWSYVDMKNVGWMFGNDGTALNDVVAVSATDAWAVGGSGHGWSDKAYTAHWDGTHWDRVAARNDTTLYTVSATPDGAAWTGGEGLCGCLLQWSGSEWLKSKSVSPPFISLSFVSAQFGWVLSETGALGWWNGSKWKSTASPPVEGQQLLAISADSTTDAWVVGGQGGGTALLEHWDGRQWTVVPA